VSMEATNKRSSGKHGFRGEQHASPSEAPRGMKMKLVDACLSLCLTRLIFSSISESAHAPSRAGVGALADARAGRFRGCRLAPGGARLNPRLMAAIPPG